MKKLLLNIVCLVALFAAGMSLKAQEITITLSPGWNWISYPNAVAMEINEALATFTPMEGDMVKGPFSFATYYQGQWNGGLTHFIPGMGYMYCSMCTETTSFVFGQASSASVVTATPTDITINRAVVGGTVTIDEGNHIFARGVCWGTEPNPDIDGSHTTDASVTGSLSDTLTELTSNTTYYVRAYVVTDYGLTYGNQQSFTTVVEYQYVDLGLPSGTLWATCNVGATSPEDYGDYFAWGETEPKDSYAWSTYQYCNGSYNTLTKYCNKSSYGFNGFTDDLTTLQPDDDAATTNWGSDWRMPTQAEFQELLDNTTLTWTQQNGVNGRLFTASNGNSLFLPAAGYRGSSSFNDAGSCGDYWSSSFNSDYPGDAWRLHFSAGNYGMNRSSRYYGQSVRPVRSASQNTSFIIDATANPAEGGEVNGVGSYQEGVECTLTATPNEGYTFTNWTENGEVVSTNATYTFFVNADRTLVANFTSNGGGDDHEYIDLGLPSGLLWATCNVGADNPEDYGDYFAWGETQPKSTYNWSTYQYCNGSNTTLTKNCNNSSYGYNGFTDTLTTLLPEDDAATANNTTVTWTTQNGVNGRLFTASNGNSLFLPVAGYRHGSSLYDAGNYGDYWSSSLNMDIPDYAWILDFNSDYYGVHDFDRYYGQSVRPVRPSIQNNAPTGAINGLFSVSESQQVYFSQGNLQYQASTNTWKFAENQWDYVGEDNGNISSTYSGWIDLFSWGTSGYNHGAVCCQPWSTSTSNSDYYAYGNYQYNLYDQTGQADWGYNAISNGGNTEGQWRTLTYDEWQYVIDNRPTLSGIRYAKANVNNVNGVIVLPDDWSSSTYSLSNTNSSGASYSSNTITASQWISLEQHGAVFLPAAGLRSGTSVIGVGSGGIYWPASCNGSSACSVFFSEYDLYTSSYASRFYGWSVRVVCPAE